MNRNEFVLKTLTRMLSAIQTGTVPHKSWGLCNNMGELQDGFKHEYPEFDRYTDTGIAIVHEFGAEWPLNTGHPDYPVPAPQSMKGTRPFDMYTHCTNMYVDEYGELRKSFLHYMIGRVTERINNVKAIGG